MLRRAQNVSVGRGIEAQNYMNDAMGKITYALVNSTLKDITMIVFHLKNLSFRRWKKCETELKRFILCLWL